jgi:tRNA(fMet)-specific endonuclease VapC
MIFDTTFLVDLMRRDTAAVQKLSDLLASKSVCWVCAPSVFELHHGVGRSAQPDKERSKISAVLREQPFMPLDASAAAIAGELSGRLGAQGASLDAMDCLIAGVAISNRMPVLTRNVKDFSKIEGLKVETY